MRILFTTTGGAGHFLPLVPFARACERAGHDVCVATQRGRASIVERAGLAVRCFDEPDPADLGAVMGRLSQATRDQANALVVGEVFGRLDCGAALPGLLEIVDDWRPDVMLRDSAEFAASIAGELRGIPVARVALGLSEMEDYLITVGAPPVSEIRVAQGLRADVAGVRLRDSACLTAVPAELDSAPGPGSASWHRFGSSDAPWTRRRRPDGIDPLVYITFGSVAGGNGFFPGLYRAAAQALAELPVRVLMTTGEAADPADLGPLPDNVRAERWLVQDDVLSEADAVVCHGGYGSTFGALSHGLPLVMVPLFSSDQWINARRVATIGAGVLLGDERRGPMEVPHEDVAARLSGCVRRVLEEPGHAQAARRVADGMAALPPVDAAVDLLRGLAASARPERDGREAAFVAQAISA